MDIVYKDDEDDILNFIMMQPKDINLNETLSLQEISIKWFIKLIIQDVFVM